MGKRIPGIRRNENTGRWEYRFTYEGHRYSVSGDTQVDCLEKRKEKEKQVDREGYLRNDKITLNQYFKEWIAQKERQVKGATVYLYTLVFRKNISPSLGRYRVREIERRQVVELMNKVADTRGIGAANYARRVIASILKGAVQDEVIARNVAESIPSLKDPRPPARETVHRELSEQELKDFFFLARNSLYYNAFRLMIHTGIRVGECLALQWKDLDFKRGMIHITKTVTRSKEGEWIVGSTPKTKKSKRDIPMNVPIRAAIKDQLEMQRDLYGSIDLCGFVFPGGNGEMAIPVTMNAVITNLIRKGGRANPSIFIEPFSVHAFRDTFASRAVRAGVPANTLKEILGHSSLAMTMDLYAHVNQQDKIEGMEKMLSVNF